MKKRIDTTFKENGFYVSLTLKRTKKKWQRSGKEVTDPVVKALTKTLVKMLRLLLRLLLRKGVEDIVIQVDFKWERKTRGWWTYSVTCETLYNAPLRLKTKLNKKKSIPGRMPTFFFLSYYPLICHPWGHYCVTQFPSLSWLIAVNVLYSTVG